MAKLLPEEVSLVDVAEIATDPSHRTATTPFGMPKGKSQRYVGDAVPWKHNLDAAPKAVRDGLDKAIKISVKCKGVTGVGMNPINHETVPNKVICQLKEAGKIK